MPNNLTQGQTINSDHIISGNKIYLDAAWRSRNIPGKQKGSSTGIGVYCLLKQGLLEEKILIQASPQVSAPSSLYAEAQGLNLAAQIAEKINIHEATFFTDNLILARAAAANRISNENVPWELREQIANYQRASRRMETKVYHISRNLNITAHECAQ